MSQSPTDTAEIVITETSVGEVAGVRVGVHSAWEDSWTDEGGTTKGGPRATLSVMGDGKDDFDVRVHKGSEVTVAGRQFRVAAIHAPSDSHGSVTLLEVGG